VNPFAAQVTAFAEVQMSFDASPGITVVVGEAANVTETLLTDGGGGDGAGGGGDGAGVGAGGGGSVATGTVIEPAAQGVRPAPFAPQQVLNRLPCEGADGFEVSPYGSAAMIPFAASDRFGFAPLASIGS